MTLRPRHLRLVEPRSEGFNLTRLTPEQQTAFAALRSALVPLERTFAGHVTTPTKRDAIVAETARVITAAARLMKVST